MVAGVELVDGPGGGFGHARGDEHDGGAVGEGVDFGVWGRWGLRVRLLRGGMVLEGGVGGVSAP